ncbi:hypothetical protein YC2023_044992 [Brassica napus]
MHLCDKEARPLPTYLKDLFLTTARTFDDNERQPLPNFAEHRNPGTGAVTKASNGATREAPKTNGGMMLNFSCHSNFTYSHGINAEMILLPEEVCAGEKLHKA